MGSQISRRKMRSQQGYLVISALSLLVGLAIFARNMLPGNDDLPAFVALLATFGIVCLGPACYRWRKGRLDPFEPPVFLCAYFFISYGLLTWPYIMGQGEQYFVLGSHVGLEDLTRALLYLLLGIIMLWIGYGSGVASWIERKLDIKAPADAFIDSQERFAGQRVPLFWIVALWLIGWIVRGYLISQGTFGYLKAQYRDVAAANLGVAELFSRLENFASYALVLSTLALLIGTGTKRKATVLWGVIVVTELFSTFILGYRTYTIFVFLNVAVTYYYVKRRLPIKWLLVGALLVLTLYPLVGPYRYAINARYLDVRDPVELFKTLIFLPGQMIDGPLEVAKLTLQGFYEFALNNGRLRDMAAVVRWADVVGEYPYRKYTLLLPLLIFVPRFLWADKPVWDIGYWYYVTVHGGTAINASPITYPGSLYLSYGFWGYLAIMCMTGVVMRFAYRRYAYSNSISVLFTAPFIWHLLLLDSDFGNSDLVGAIVGGARQLIVLLLVRRLVFGRSQPKHLR